MIHIQTFEELSKLINYNMTRRYLQIWKKSHPTVQKSNQVVRREHSLVTSFCRFRIHVYSTAFGVHAALHLIYVKFRCDVHPFYYGELSQDMSNANVIQDHFPVIKCLQISISEELNGRRRRVYFCFFFKITCTRFYTLQRSIPASLKRLFLFCPLLFHYKAARIQLRLFGIVVCFLIRRRCSLA